MADDLSLFDVFAANIPGIIQIQACIRGFLVRKWLWQLRQIYSDIVQELEGNAHVCTEWRSKLPCYPKCHKQKKTQQNKNTLNQDSVTETVDKCKSKNSNFSKNLSLGIDQPSQNTVETQTSSMDISTEPTLLINKGKQSTEAQTVCKPKYCDAGTDFAHKDVLVDCDTQDVVTTDVNCTIGSCSVTVINDGQPSLPAEKHFTQSHKLEHENSSEGGRRSVIRHDIESVPQLFPSVARQNQPPILMSEAVSESPIKLRQPHSSVQEISTFTELTSVWDSFSRASPQQELMDSAQLQDMQKNVAMELLWVQQAINSRKHYLKLKSKIGKVDNC